MRNNFFGNIKISLNLIGNVSHGYLLLNFLFSFVLAFLPLFLLFLIKLLIDSLGNTHFSGMSDFLGSHSSILLLGISAVFFLNHIFTLLSEYVKDIHAFKMSTLIHDSIHKKAADLNLSIFENAQYQNLLYKTMQESSSRIFALLTQVLSVFQNIISLILLFVLMVSLQWTLALFLLSMALLIILFRMKYYRKVSDYDKKNMETERKVSYYHRLLTAEIFAKEIKLHGLFEIISQRFNQSRTQLHTQKQILRRNNYLREAIIFFTIGLFMFVAFSYLVYSAIVGEISIGALVMYFFAFQRGFSYVKNLSFSVSSFFENVLFLNYYYDFLNIPSETNESDEPVIPEKMSIGIQLKDVSYTYPGKSNEAVKNINMNILPGETIAIVGENGAGKSTLVKLLSHLYDATRGDIYMEGINYNKFSGSTIQKRISVMFQDYILFNMTARENICFGNVTAVPDEEKMRAAARKAKIHDDIMKLPKGYDTTLGKLFDNSSELSIGQSQKLALARAFYKDADILILDEPSSSLDAKAEYEIFQQFKELSKGKTTIYISHRFSTVKLADRIYVMDQGAIIECGSHNELMQLNGKYAHLYHLQAESYIS